MLFFSCYLAWLTFNKTFYLNSHKSREKIFGPFSGDLSRCCCVGWRWDEMRNMFWDEGEVAEEVSRVGKARTWEGKGEGLQGCWSVKWWDDGTSDFDARRQHRLSRQLVLWCFFGHGVWSCQHYLTVLVQDFSKSPENFQKQVDLKFLKSSAANHNHKLFKIHSFWSQLRYRYLPLGLHPTPPRHVCRGSGSVMKLKKGNREKFQIHSIFSSTQIK